MATEEQLSQLRQAYENGTLNKNTYETMLKALGIGIVDIKDSQVGVVGDNAKIEGGIHHGDRVDIDSGRDTIFAKDQGIALVIKALNLTIKEKTNIRQTLRRYLSDLAARTNLLPWGQLSPEQAGPEQGESLHLSDVYTALDTTEPERMDCEEDIRECLFHREKQKRISAQQMANDHERLVLLGDPGSGKTTLVNFLTHIMACTGTEKDPDVFIKRLKKAGEWDHGSLFPLRILLRDFAAWMEKNPDRNSDMGAFLRNSLKEDGYDDFWPFIHEGLQNRKIPFLVLLDGLDEVPADIRGKIVSIISDFTETYRYNRYIVTCRIYAYIDPAFRLPKFRQTVLAPFTIEQISSFTDAWYSELAEQKRKSRAEAQRLADSLKSAVRRPELLALAQRPLIMTVMALLHTSYGQLPEDRVELYKWATDLLFRRWQGQAKGEKSLMAALDMPQLRMSDLEAGLYYIAFYAHSGHGYSEGTADIPEEMLRKQLSSYIGNSWDKAGIFVHYIRERAGLLIRHKTDAYTFPHRTFQEFMAACHITGLKEYPREAARLVCEDPDRWRVVFVLAAGHAARTHQLGNAIASVAKLCPASIAETGKPPDRAAFGKAVISGEALFEIGLVGVNREEDGQIILERIRAWLLAAMQADDVLRPEERVEAGNILSQLGDPRFDQKNWYLPVGKDMGFVTVPAGPFLMGSDKKEDSNAEDDEFPQHRIELSEYRIARYPVTVAQFRAFVEDSGFKPGDKACLKGLDNHPVIWISWDEATVYCRWLTEKLTSQGEDCRISLPTEVQWEKAARGTEGRIYPWGNQAIEPDRANYRDTGIGTTSPVGCFPAGNGVLDMIGNVWEWCQDWFDGDYYSKTPAVDPVNTEKSTRRVLRGGSWFHSARGCRSAFRDRNCPDYRCGFLGFRLVLFPGQQAQHPGAVSNTIQVQSGYEKRK